jgi:hypothetical protein
MLGVHLNAVWCRIFCQASTQLVALRSIALALSLVFSAPAIQASQDIDALHFSPTPQCRHAHTSTDFWVFTSSGESNPELFDQRFINVKGPGSADLEHSFSVILDDRMAYLPIPEYGFEGGVHYTPPIKYLVSRGQFWKDQKQSYTPIRESLRNPNIKIQQASDLSDVKNGMLGELYGSYAGQGPERSTELANYQQEDAETIHRATTFIMIVQDKPSIHIQALSSSGPHEPLNLERHFPNYKVHRKSGKPVFEIGRLIFSKSIEARILAKYIAQDDPNIIMQISIYQKLFSWLNSDVEAETALMQVNDQIYTVLHSKKIGLQFAKEDIVIGPTGAREWVLTMDRDSMLASEENLMRAILLSRMSKEFIRQAPSEHDKVLIHFRPNELDVLRRMGLVSLTPNPAPPATYIPPEIFLAPDRTLSLVFERAAAQIYLQNPRQLP